MAKEVFGSKNSIGEVQIASDVVSAIAGISAAEVDGVQSMAGGSINDIAGKLGMKNYSKGVDRKSNDGWLGELYISLQLYPF